MGAAAVIGASTLLFMRTGAKSKALQSCILSIDQGTTSSRVLVIDQNLKVLDVATREHRQISSKPGWVEHDPEQIYNNVVECLTEVQQRNNLDVRAVGITNQRETTVAFDKKTGKPFHNAIVWLD